jgi:hypothetical protein
VAIKKKDAAKTAFRKEASLRRSALNCSVQPVLEYSNLLTLKTRMSSFVAPFGS